MAWYRDQYIANILDALTELRYGHEIIGKTGTRQVAGVNTFTGDALELGTIAPPDFDLQAAASQLQSEGSSPGAGTDDGNRLCRFFLY